MNKMDLLNMGAVLMLSGWLISQSLKIKKLSKKQSIKVIKKKITTGKPVRRTRAKITPELVNQVIVMGQTSMKHREIAKHVGCSQASVSTILKNSNERQQSLIQ